MIRYVVKELCDDVLGALNKKTFYRQSLPGLNSK